MYAFRVSVSRMVRKYSKSCDILRDTVHGAMGVPECRHPVGPSWIVVYSSSVSHSCVDVAWQTRNDMTRLT